MRFLTPLEPQKSLPILTSSKCVPKKAFQLEDAHRVGAVPTFFRTNLRTGAPFPKSFFRDKLRGISGGFISAVVEELRSDEARVAFAAVLVILQNNVVVLQL